MADPQQPPSSRFVSPLDRPAARLAALGVLLLVLAGLAGVHRDRLFPPEVAPLAADDPAALCFARRAADIDGMLAEGAINAEQAGLFKSRAEAFCVAQHGQGGPPAGQGFGTQ